MRMEVRMRTMKVHFDSLRTCKLLHNTVRAENHKAMHTLQQPNNLDERLHEIIERNVKHAHE